MAKAKGNKKALAWFKGFFYLVLCTFSLAVGTTAGYVGHSKVLTSLAVSLIKRTPPSQVFGKNDLSLLILGCDEDLTPGGKTIIHKQARSDMLMLVHFDFANKVVSGLSIPRDTWLKMDGYPGHKMNAFHAVGGNELSQKAVEKLLGVSVDRTITLDFKAFQEMVDVLGGVYLDVPKDMKYTDKAGGLFINLKAGPQLLNGYNAMCFVRFRHNDSDFARSDRQHQFVLAFKDALMKSPQRLDPVLTKAIDVLGGELTVDECASLGLFAKGIPQKNILMGTIPVQEKSGTTALYLNKRELAKTLKTYHFTSNSGDDN